MRQSEHNCRLFLQSYASLASCSAALRLHGCALAPAAKRRPTKSATTSLAGIQARLLASATQLACPDGRLLYATCSLAPAENQGVAHQLPGWRVLAEKLHWPDAWQAGGYECLLVRTIGVRLSFNYMKQHRNSGLAICGCHLSFHLSNQGDAVKLGADGGGSSFKVAANRRRWAAYRVRP